MRPSISDILTDLLSVGHITESELARRTHLPKATINRIISGRTPDPRSSTLLIIADYFNISIDQLMGKKPITSCSKNSTQNNELNVIIEKELLKEILDQTISLQHTTILAKDFSKFLLDVVIDMASLDATMDIKKKMLDIAMSSVFLLNQEKNGKVA